MLRSITSNSWRSCLLGSCLLLALPCQAQTVHLLGFVAELCELETYCFELRVKAKFQATVGERIKVRFDQDTRLFDPENYELTLAQQNIVPGSHLRLLLEADAGYDPPGYRASYIWIGD